MKVIKINESQKNRLFEAYREGFSLEELSALGEKGCEYQYDYCVKWLGEPDGFGSSRCVFTLSDNMILKLAYKAKYDNFYEAGIAQNKQEYEIYKMFESPLLVKIYNVDKNFTYLVCESVVPASEIDFEKILGIPFGNFWHQNTRKEIDNFSKHKGDTEIGYNKYFGNIKGYMEESEDSLYDVLCYIESNYATDDPYYSKKMENIINDSKWLTELKKFVKRTKISDFCNVENFGIVNRDGNPTLVLLDCGLNMAIWEKYYN